MKALLIGANGQLGRTLSQFVPGNVSLEALDLPAIDITDQEQVEKVVSAALPDVIINAAAYTAVDRAEDELSLAFSINADGPKNLARAAVEYSARLIHISTDYVFDGTACRPYPPDAVCNPLGVYGKSKWEGEKQVQSIIDDHVIVRTSWLYSRYGNNFVLTMLRLMREKKELRVVADQIGSPTWAATLADAVWRIVAKPELKGIYHWSDAGVASWYDFAVAIQEEAVRLNILERATPIHPIASKDYPQKAKRPFYSVLACNASWQNLNKNPTHWRAALRATFDQTQASTSED